MTNRDINWNAVLRKALTAYPNGSEVSENKVERPEPQDIAFLEGALREAQQGGDISYYEAVRKIAAPKLDSVSSDQDVIAALNLIDDALTNEPEIARDLDKVQVVDGLIGILKERKNTDVLVAVCGVLSFALGNNPRIQRIFYSAGLLDVIMGKFYDGNLSDFSAVAADAQQKNIFTRHLSVLSALIRHVHEIEDTFINRWKGETFLLLVKDSPLNQINTPSDTTTSSAIGLRVQSLLEHLRHCTSCKHPVEQIDTLC